MGTRERYTSKIWLTGHTLSLSIAVTPNSQFEDFLGAGERKNGAGACSRPYYKGSQHVHSPVRNRVTLMC